MPTQYVNKATLNGTSTVYWVTSGAADTTGAQSGYNIASLTNITVDYTTNVATTSTGGNTLSNGGWTTALDFDFTAQTTQTLSTDGTYNIGGISFTKINSANDSSPMTITNGQGLVITPVSNTDYHNTTRTLPALNVSLSSIIPNFDINVPIRVWVYVSSDNASNNYDFFRFAIENGTNYNFYISRGYATGTYAGNTGISIGSNISGVDQGDYSNSSVYSNNVLVAELATGVASGYFLGFAGTYGTTWPAFSSLLAMGRSEPANQALNAVTGSASNWNILIGALRAGSATNYVVKVARIKVEYFATAPLTVGTISLSDQYSNLPTAGVSGRIFLPTNGNVVLRDNGTSWQHFGPIVPLTTPPTASNFTIIQTAANGTLVDDNGGLYFSALQRVASEDSVFAVQANPGGTGAAYTLIAGIIPIPGGKNGAGGFYNYHVTGIGLYNSTTTQIRNLTVYTDGTGAFRLQLAGKTGLTTTGSATFDVGGYPVIAGPMIWLKVQDDGITNRTWSVSTDGRHFKPVTIEARTTGFTTQPDKIGLYINPYNADAQMNILSYSLTSP